MKLTPRDVILLAAMGIEVEMEDDPLANTRELTDDELDNLLDAITRRQQKERRWRLPK